MRNLLFLAIFFLNTSNVFATFSPTLLKFSANNCFMYDFDGSTLEIPFNQSGTPATVVFSVFTKYKSSEIVNIRNGNLGWHYVNRIDTCIYLAPPKHYEPGENSIYWEGRTIEGDIVKSDSYAFYIWGYDDTNPRKPVTKALPFNRLENAVIVTKNENGIVLSNPLIYESPESYRFDAPPGLSLSRFMRWSIGNDPEDTALVESTFISEYNSGMGFAVDYTHQAPGVNQTTIYHETYDWDVSGAYYLEKMWWVPNGMAVTAYNWGVDYGRTSINVGKGNNSVKAGVYNYNDTELLTTYSCPGNTCMDCNLVYIDIATGLQGRSENLKDTYTWYNFKKGQWQNRGPTSMNLVNGRLYFGQAYSTVMACANPDGDISDGNFWLWKNLYGDNFHDNYDDNPDFTGAYQYPYCGVQDANWHTITNADGLNGLAFDLTLPDGTGAGYYKFADTPEGIGDGNFLLMLDSGSAYDGIYTSELSQDGTGWSYIAHDSISGILYGYNDGINQSTPISFSLSQNSPNPFNPATTIDFTLPEECPVSVEIFNIYGQKITTLADSRMSAGIHSVRWDGGSFSAGIYICRVKAGDNVKTIKMLLIK